VTKRAKGSSKNLRTPKENEKVWTTGRRLPRQKSTEEERRPILTPKSLRPEQMNDPSRKFKEIA